MQRVPDWERRLSEFLLTRQHRPFKWGEHDCCTFAADAVQILTNVDHIAIWRGYDDEVSAREMLSAVGGSVRRSLFKILGDPLFNILFMKRGDIALIKTPFGYGAAVVLGETLAAVSQDGGWVHLPSCEALVVWKI